METMKSWYFQFCILNHSELGPVIQVEAHILKSLSQNCTREIQSQILHVVSTYRITRKITEISFAPDLLHQLYYEALQCIWYGTVRGSLFNHMAFLFFFFKKRQSFTYLCKSTRMLGRRFSFWAPNLAKALTAAIMEHKMGQHKYWFLS